MIWVDMKKIDILLAQIRSGMNMELEDFDNFIVSELAHNHISTNLMQ